MWRIGTIAVAGVIGAAALLIGEAEMRLADQEAALAARGETAAEESRMRVCVGPARVTLGGQPFARLAFGGEGCRRSVANVVGFRILRSEAAATSVMSFRPF